MLQSKYTATLHSSDKIFPIERKNGKEIYCILIYNKYLVICIVYLYLIISSEIKGVQNKMYHETFYSKLIDMLPALVLIVGSTSSACSSISPRVVGILNAHSGGALFLPCCCCCPLCCCSCSPCGCCGL